MGFRNIYMVEMLDELEDFCSVCACETEEDADHLIRERGFVKASDSSSCYVLDVENAHKCSRGLVFCECEDCPIYLEWVDRVGDDIQMIVKTYPCEDYSCMFAPEDEQTRYYIRGFSMYERD